MELASRADAGTCSQSKSNILLKGATGSSRHAEKVGSWCSSCSRRTVLASGVSARFCSHCGQNLSAFPETRPGLNTGLGGAHSAEIGLHGSTKRVQLSGRGMNVAMIAVMCGMALISASIFWGHQADVTRHDFYAMDHSSLHARSGFLRSGGHPAFQSIGVRANHSAPVIIAPVATSMILLVFLATYLLCRHRLLNIADLQEEPSKAAATSKKQRKVSFHEQPHVVDMTKPGNQPGRSSAPAKSALSARSQLIPASKVPCCPQPPVQAQVDRDVEKAGNEEVVSAESDDGFESCEEGESQDAPQHSQSINPNQRHPKFEDLLSNLTQLQVQKVNELALHLGQGIFERNLCTAFGDAEVTAWRFLQCSAWEMSVAKSRAGETARWRAHVLAARIDFKQDEASASLSALFSSGDIPPRLPCIGWDGGIYSSKTQPQWWHAKDGSPMELWNLEHLDLSAVFNRTVSQELILDGYLEYNERRRQRLNSVGAAGFIVLIDAAGFDQAHFRKSMPFVRQAAKLIGDIGEKHYPGCTRAVIVFNASALVNMLFRALSPSLSAATQSVITISPEPAHKVPELVALTEPAVVAQMQVACH